MVELASGARGIKITLILYSLLLVALLIAFIVTNILVLLAEAFDAVSDIIISTFLLLSVYWSQKPADEFHMFGYGRAQNVAALVAATVSISFLSLEMFRQAVPKLF